jgi:hypothetical protein
MRITQKAWNKYITKMSAISGTAAEKMQEYVSVHGFDDMKAVVEYAKALSDHYGEAIGSLACQMYDATAAAQGVIVPDAEIAELPEYGDVAKAVYGAKKTSENEVSKAVGRLVKQVGADTTLKNAERDGAQFAWVPSGDTCAFCITLASRGWQYMSKQALKNGHAEHIHANCDCQYAIRFDGESGVAGYDPDKYLAMYENAEGISSQEKINSMRRAMYAKTKEGASDKIENKARELKIPQIPASIINEKVRSGEYSLKLSTQQFNKHVEGMREYEVYKNARIEKGNSPQSKLTISQEEAQKIIENKAGTGIIKVRRDGTAMNIEQITCESTIGEYWQKGDWKKTNKAAIHYGKRGAHLVPIKGNDYD